MKTQSGFVAVREKKKNSIMRLCQRHKACQYQAACQFAHSPSELDYWRGIYIRICLVNVLYLYTCVIMEYGT